MDLIKSLLEVKDFGDWMNSHGPKKDQPSSKPVTPSQAPTKPKVNKTDYDDSAEFTDDMIDAKDHLEKFLNIVASEKFRRWMEETDLNFSTDCVDKLDEVLGNLHSTQEAYNNLLDEIDRAQ